MALRDVIGQERAVKVLLRTIQKGRIPSSYLFAGESAIGKKFTAINLAKALNCLKSPSPPFNSSPTKGRHRGVKEGMDEFEKDGQSWDVDCCDKCPSCKKIDAGVHPDFLLISPHGGQIRIEEIRAIDEMLSFKPFEGRKKIIIVDEADTMNPFAANAFLKTLEEPPEESLIILVSQKPDRLPDTIRSRCSRVNFTPLSHEACKKVIEKIKGQESKTRNTSSVPGNKKVLDSQLSTLVRLSMGRPGLAISSDLIEERTWCLKLLQGMLKAEKDGWASREEIERWLDLIIVLLRDVAILRITQDEKSLINIDLKDYIQNLSSSMDLVVIIENYEKLSILKGYLNFNLNKSLTWNFVGSLLRRAMHNTYA